MRQTLNTLEFLSANSSVEQKFDAKSYEKDLKLGNFEVVRRVFSTESQKDVLINEKSNKKTKPQIKNIRNNQWAKRIELGTNIERVERI